METLIFIIISRKNPTHSPLSAVLCLAACQAPSSGHVPTKGRPQPGPVLLLEYLAQGMVHKWHSKDWLDQRMYN